MKRQYFCWLLLFVLISCEQQENTSLAPDSLDPVVSIILPAPSDTLRGLVDVEVEASDNVGIDRVEFYLDGILPDSQAVDSAYPYLYSWDTKTATDGVHLIYVRAFDFSENYGDAVPFLVQVDNINENAPRTLRVPSEYPTIQQGVNAARDGDTVLVEPGIYHEDFSFKGKGIWVKSEMGPAETIWDGLYQNIFVYFNGGEDTTSVLCGFKISDSYDGIIIDVNCSPKIINCIFVNMDYCGIIGGPSMARIANNTFFNCQYGLAIGGLSSVINNIVVSGSQIGLWSASGDPQYRPLGDYNNVWDWGEGNYGNGWIIGEHDISINPLFEDSIYFPLQIESPCINTGNPELLDPDGTRSDIGAWGGPHSY